MARYSSGKRARDRIAPVAVMATCLFVCFRVAADEVASAAPASSAAAAATAIRVAEIAIQRAANEGNLWLGTRRLLARAASYQAAGDYARAVAFAGVAEREASAALNQAQLERARYLFDQLDGERDGDDVNAVRGLLRAHDGDAALRLMRGLSGR